MPARARAKLGLARTYQQSRMLLGPDGRGRDLPLHPRREQRPPASRASCAEETGEIRKRAREAAGAWPSTTGFGTWSATSPTESTARSRLAMALAAEPKVLMLDEPASGLSRGERKLLTELLLSLDRDITLLLIEHDMDVALPVAERVTMMHDGRVIVEGTPDEIRGQPARPRPLPRQRPLREKDAMSEPVLAVDGLDAYYGSAQCLQDVTFEMGRRVGRDHRAERHGQDDALRRDHGAVAAAHAGSIRSSRRGAPRPAFVQDRACGHRLRAAGAPTVPFAHGRRAPAHARRPQRRGGWTIEEGLRAVPAARRAQEERRCPALGRRAADACHRPRAVDKPKAPDHGRAVRGAGAGDHREPDRASFGGSSRRGCASC